MSIYARPITKWMGLINGYRSSISKAITLMLPIKFILIVFLLIVSILYLKYLRTGLLDRVIVFVLSLCCCLAITFPDSTTTIAHLVGVGRGTDLIFYLFFFINLFCLIILYGKMYMLKNTISNVVSELAILGAEKMDKKD
jgi:small membrane protein